MKMKMKKENSMNRDLKHLCATHAILAWAVAAVEKDEMIFVLYVNKK